jgi:putative flippase GtrA
MKITEIIRYIDEKIDLKKFIKFGITGLVNTAIDIAVYALCLEIFGLDIKIAQAAGQGTAITNSYFMNKNWTFQKREKHNISQILKFLLINGGSIAINTFSVHILHNNLGLDKYLCKIPIAAITIVINYFGNKLFVFNENKNG